MRKKIIAGNWKMHKTVREAEELVGSILKGLPETHYEVVVCPPFTALYRISQLLEGSRLKLGAQNMHYEIQGAFTGEISAGMLKDLGCRFVILGHSERRHIFGETDELIGKKISAALEAGLRPIFCIGELLAEREAGKTHEVVTRQLKAGLSSLEAEQMPSVVIAYEPVWAIGTGKAATAQQAEEVHIFIREWFSQNYSEDIAQNLIILYGGSVKPENIDSLMAQKDINGVLVGGASLDKDSFLRIIDYRV